MIASVDQPQHIAIVGGGMVGVSLALMLAKNVGNTSISLIEKFPFPETNSSSIEQPSFDARSTALSAGSVALLQTIDCWSELSQYAEPIQHIHISDRGHYGNTLLHASDYDVDALGYVVENSRLGQCLLQQLQQTHVKCIAPATVEQCQLKKQGVELQLKGGNGAELLLADLVVIADGADSPLRASLGIDHHITQYQQSAIITNVSLQKSHGNIAYERFTDQGPLALLPLNEYNGEHRASVVWTRDTQHTDDLMQLNDEDFKQALQACLGYRADRIKHVGKRQSYPLQLVQAAEQVRSNIVVVGNAAHFLHPVAGQGFNLSLRDSASLAQVLQQGLSHHPSVGNYKTLKHYVHQREKDQAVTIGLTDIMVKTFSSSQLSMSILRQLGLLSLQTFPAMKKTLAKQMMGMA